MKESINETYFVEVLRQRGKHNNYEVEFGLNDGTKINTDGREIGRASCRERV